MIETENKIYRTPEWMRVERCFTSCVECSLGGGKVCSEANPGCKVLIVGESPGETEVSTLTPFHPDAAAGSILSYGMRRGGFNREQCYLMNLISCRPPENKLLSEEGRKALACCEEGFYDELHTTLEKYNIRVILALGANPAESLGCAPGQSITEIRGYVFEYKGVPVIPTFHPSYVYRQRSHKGGDTSALNAIWVKDLEKVKFILDNGYQKPVKHFNMFPTLQDVVSFHNRVVANETLLSSDTETNGLKPHTAKLDLIGFADTATTGISIPMWKQGGGDYWTVGEWFHVKKLVQDIYNKCPTFYHNAGFDTAVLKTNGFPVPRERIVHDTTLAWHTCYPGLEKNLNFVASVMAMVPYWKDVLKGRKGRHKDMPDAEFRGYNADDCMNLHPVLEALLKMIHADPFLKDIYYNETMPLVPIIAGMVEEGFYIDQVKLKQYRDYVIGKITEKKKVLFELANLPNGFNINSVDDIRYFLFGIKPNKFGRVKELTATKDKLLFVWKCEQCGREELSTKSKKPVIHPIPLSKKDGDLCIRPVEGEGYDAHTTIGEHKWKRTDEQRTIQVPKMKAGTGKEKTLIDLQTMIDGIKPIYLLGGYTGRFTKTKKKSTDKIGLLSFIRALNNRLAKVQTFIRNPEAKEQEMKDIRKLIVWITAYMEAKKWEKQRSTYTQYDVDKNGRVHTSLDQAGTETSRLSSDDPNLLNLTRPDDKEPINVRDAFAAAPGYVLVDADYAQLEVIVLAYMCEDEGLIHIIENGLKLHDENTKFMFKTDKSNPKWDKLRDLAKRIQFGMIQYGGQPQTIYEKTLAEMPDCELTLAQFVELKNRYFQKYPQMAKWQEEQKQFALDKGYCLTGFGSRRYLTGTKHDIEKQAINTPIQKTAAHIMNRSMIRLDKAIAPYGRENIRLILQVYDELILEVKNEPSLIAAAKQHLVESMLVPVTFLNGRTPKLEVEAKVGYTWGDIKNKSVKSLA